MRRERIRSGTPWEERVGYSRAIRAGDRVIVSGTTATEETDDGVRLVEGGAYDQARQAMENVVEALKSAGANADDVVRTRIYVLDIDRWEPIGRAHREVFGQAGPATTMVEVSRLVDERMVVEVEAEAIVDS